MEKNSYVKFCHPKFIMQKCIHTTIRTNYSWQSVLNHSPCIRKHTSVMSSDSKGEGYGILLDLERNYGTLMHRLLRQMPALHPAPETKSSFRTLKGHSIVQF